MTHPLDASRVASRYLKADSDAHRKSVALMKFLSGVARKEGVAKHVYVVGGAVRNYLLGVPIKDIDVVVDSVELGRGRDSEWFAKQVADAIPVASSLVTNQYGVAILTVKGEWLLDGINLKGEVIEIANARKESYEGAGGKGKGYKPTDVSPANIREDVLRREFTFNTLLWRMLDLAEGPDKAEIIDLTGLGRAHLEERLIATPVNPDKTFSDDPTRQLRILKFLLRYNLKISPDVVASVKRNAHKLKQMPWEAVANILVNDILNSPRASEGIKVMRSLGILDVIVEMVKEVPPFATFLNRQLMSGNRPVSLLLELADLGISGKATEFLTGDQYRRFQSLVGSLSAEESRRLLDALRKPDLDNSALIQEFALEGRERGALIGLAREALLSDPSLVTNPVALNDQVRNQLRMSRPAPARIASRYLSAKGKYDDIDFQPPKSVASEAEKGLKYREKASPSNKGGLTSAEAGKQGIGSGVQRAVNLKNRDNVTPETISKMLGFFARHEKNKGVAPENRDKPWNDKGHVAWLLWGGDAGRTWAEKVKAQMDRADEKNKTAAEELNPHARRMTYEQFKKDYFAEEPDVRDSIAKEFWSDFKYGFNGPLSKYIKETTSKAASRVAYEIYVDEDGYAHDDEGNVEYVGKGYGGTYTGTRGLPRSRYQAPQYQAPRTPPNPELLKLSEIAAALGNQKDAEVLRDFAAKINRFPMTEKQIRYLDSLKKRYVGKNPEQILREREKLEAKPGSGELMGRVQKLNEEAKSKGNSWMAEFSQSILQQLSRGRTLSEKQQAVLDRGFKQFRIASPSPATSGQISYAKSLIEQGLKGIPATRRSPEVPAWIQRGDAPTDAQLAKMDSAAISVLIDSLKSRKPFKVERYGNGGFRILPKLASHQADLEDACWDGYEAVGMKEKDGKLVPNCVPVKTASPVRVADRFLRVR